MKKLKSFFAALVAVVMTLALGTTAFAADDTSYSITVNNTNSKISIEGNTYSAYKIFDVTYATYTGDSTVHTAYTIDDDFKNFVYTPSGASASEAQYSGENLVKYIATLKTDSAELDNFANAALAYAVANNIAADGTATAVNANAVTIDVTAAGAGYYLVAGKAHDAADKDKTVVASCSLDTTLPNATVKVKADIPSVKKEMDSGKTSNTKNVGDTVDYTVTSAVPDMTGYTKYFFVMQDTLSKGLTYNDDVKVSVNGTELVKGDGYTTSYETDETTGVTTLKVVFKNFIQYKNNKGAEIKVTYSAIINEQAIVGKDPNTNDVIIKYSNDPTSTPQSDTDEPGEGDATGETPKSTTYTYVSGLKLKKVDAGDGTKTLAGAKFSIKGESQKVVITNKEMYKADTNGAYWMLKDGTYTTDAPVTDKTSDKYNADKYDSTTDKYTKVTVVNKDTVASDITATGYVNKDGILTFEGLGEGTYTITELVAPAGYNLLEKPITVVTSATIDTTTNTATWYASVDGGNAVKMDDDGIINITVKNTTGTELPETGGMGTTLFYVIGGLLVVGAGVVLVTMKRMNKSK